MELLFILKKIPLLFPLIRDFPGGLDSQQSTCNAGKLGLIPGSGRSSGEGNGYPLQDSCLENSMDRGAWQATICGVTKSWMWLTLSLFTFLLIKTQCALVLSFSNFQSARLHQRHIIKLWSTGSLGLLHGTTVKSQVPQTFLGDGLNKCSEMYNYLR